MAYQQQDRKPLPKTAFDELKLRLEGVKPEGAKRPPQLRVSVIKNSPRIDVFTNIEGDTDNGRISAPMDAKTFFALIICVEDIAAGEPDQQIKIANKVGAPGQQRIISHTIIGKDKDGRMFISVIAKDRPRIKFQFIPGDWHELAMMDGTPLDEARLTNIYARGWAKLMAELAPNVMDHHFEERVYNQNGGGGYNKGGYNKGNGGGGGYQKSNQSGGGDAPGNSYGGTHNDTNTDFDDEFPM